MVTAKPLPDISIKIDINAKSFLKSIEKLSKNSDLYSETRSQWEQLFGKGFYIVAFKPTDQRGNTDLIGQVISHGDNVDRVQVEIRGFTERPSYEEYVTCAKTIVKPLIKQYNKENTKRFRVTIHKENIKEYSLPPGAKKHFKSFTMFPDSTHPADKHRFHFFIRYCHQHNVKLSGTKFKELLLSEGYTEEKAHRYKETYVCGREILGFNYGKY